MNHTGGHQMHMWLIGIAAVAALLLGWGVGWALAFALLACAAMFVAVFWIGRSSVQRTPAPRPEQHEESRAS